MANEHDIPPLQVIQGGAAQSTTTGAIEALAARQAEKAGDKPSASATMIDSADSLTFFHSPDHVAFVSVLVREQRQVWRVRSSEFRLWLRHQYFDATGSAPPAQALEDAIGVLEARAEFDSPEQVTFIRVGADGGEYYVDLARKEGPSVVKVTADGWEIAPDAPINFERPKSALPLPLPARGGSLSQLRPFVNVASAEMFVLLGAWLVAALFGSFPVPVLIIQGPQGSAKSTLLRVLRMLVDPAKGILRGQPRHEHDLAIAASRSWLVTFDNLSTIPDWLSDAFCRIVTGGAFAARQLFTDGDEVIFEYRRPAILNGIEELATRSDLLDRAVVVTLPKIDDAGRRDEEEFWKSFEAAQPLILGALFDLMAGVLKHLPSVELQQKPRMADFARIGTALEASQGWAPGTFMPIYAGNRAIGNGIAIEASLIGPYIKAMAFQEGGWQGTPEHLLGCLDNLYDRARAGRPPGASFGQFTHDPPRAPKPKAWPSNAQQLSAKLQRIQPNLAEEGVLVERGQTSGSQSEKFIRLSLKASTSVPPYSGSPAA